MPISVFFVFHCAGNINGWFPVDCLWSITNDSTRDMRGWGGRVESRWRQLFLRECARKIILAWNFLCQAEAQYQVPVRLPVLQGTLIRDYNFTSMTVIRPLNQPRMFEIGFMSFSSMIWLKVVSMNRASLQSMISNERTNRENVSIDLVSY